MLFDLKHFRPCLLIAVTALIPFEIAFAQSASDMTINTNITSTSLYQSWARLTEQLALEYNAFATGLGSSNERTVGEDGKIEEEPTSNQMENELFLGLKLNENVTSGAVAMWALRPGYEETYETLDPYFKLSYDNLVSIDTFSFGADLRISAPISEESKEHGLITAIASEQTYEFVIPKSRYSLEMETFFQYSFYKKDGDASDFEFLFSPGVTYQLTKKLVGLLAYESEMSHRRHADLTLIDNTDATIKSGVNWRVSSQLNVLPYFDYNLKDVSGSLLGAELQWVIL